MVDVALAWSSWPIAKAAFLNEVNEVFEPSGAAVNGEDPFPYRNGLVGRFGVLSAVNPDGRSVIHSDSVRGEAVCHVRSYWHTVENQGRRQLD